MSIHTELEHEARYGDADSFMSLAKKTIQKGDEHLYETMAEIAATEGNLPIIRAISQVFYLDYEAVATMARTYGHYDVAGELTGEEVVVPEWDTPTTEDLEDDRADQAEMWENSAGYTYVKTDMPIEEIDTSQRYKIMGTRRWGWKDDPVDITRMRRSWSPTNNDDYIDDPSLYDKNWGWNDIDSQIPSYDRKGRSNHRDTPTPFTWIRARDPLSTTMEWRDSP
jgi:hypothetical protein